MGRERTGESFGAAKFCGSQTDRRRLFNSPSSISWFYFFSGCILLRICRSESTRDTRSTRSTVVHKKIMMLYLHPTFGSWTKSASGRSPPFQLLLHALVDIPATKSVRIHRQAHSVHLVYYLLHAALSGTAAAPCAVDY